MSRLVRSLGMETNEFASGREFVDRIETTPSFQPDCVVLDVQMPGMNGLEVQERLASRGSRLPVIFITAYDEPGVRDRALAAGGGGFLPQTFHSETCIPTLPPPRPQKKTTQTTY